MRIQPRGNRLPHSDGQRIIENLQRTLCFIHSQPAVVDPPEPVEQLIEVMPSDPMYGSSHLLWWLRR